MDCQCCFYKDNKKYLVRCPYCKTNSIKKYKWYEWHIISMRDNPDIRLISELFILSGSFILLSIAYYQHHKLIDFHSNIFFNYFIKIFLIIYIIILFIFVDGQIKLNNDIYYQL